MKLKAVRRDAEQIELLHRQVVGQCRLQETQGAGKTHGKPGENERLMSQNLTHSKSRFKHGTATDKGQVVFLGRSQIEASVRNGGRFALLLYLFGGVQNQPHRSARPVQNTNARLRYGDLLLLCVMPNVAEASAQVGIV